MKELVNGLFSAARQLSRRLILRVTKRNCLKFKKGLHIGGNVRIWAPEKVRIGRNVYIGRDVHIECDIIIGNHCLVANQAAFIGKYDHDYKEIGVPIRFSRWIGEKEYRKQILKENREIIIEDDVWVGFRSVILSGVTVGKGAIVAAGSLVTKDVQAYSIVAGIPAKKVGVRFESDEILKHEKIVERGEYEYSLLGLQFSKTKKGL